jgi:hypothetical protein
MYDEIDRYLDDSDDETPGAAARAMAEYTRPGGRRDRLAPPDDALGPCGCIDYHLADCPVRGRS